MEKLYILLNKNHSLIDFICPQNKPIFHGVKNEEPLLCMGIKELLLLNTNKNDEKNEQNNNNNNGDDEIDLDHHYYDKDDDCKKKGCYCRGPRGKRGKRGYQGEPGPRGFNGTTTIITKYGVGCPLEKLTQRTESRPIPIENTGYYSVECTCNAGEYLINGGCSYKN